MMEPDDIDPHVFMLVDAPSDDMGANETTGDAWAELAYLIEPVLPMFSEVVMYDPQKRSLTSRMWASGFTLLLSLARQLNQQNIPWHYTTQPLDH